ncbi:PAS domain-containing sensor histidine kinase [Fulvivirga sp. 29W222]|uniref:histidine kinase n=1 Tax=Fulvivirga marina TaxID=2494733 RepID=A0A937KET2_9BACT|nr:PAS domain-containing sensor histidine kinase [Fulvivirga marina]MBL6449899.1 PAS domain-containing sensor histidine kinase [Fulvivirga marina]
MKSLRFRNFFVKKNEYIESWSLYKRVILTGQISMICLVVGLFYMVFDLINDTFSALFIYFGFIGCSIVTYLLNRNGCYVAAKVCILLAANFAVFCTYEMEPPGTASFIFFIPCVIGAFTLFDFDERLVSYFFSTLSISLFFITSSSDFAFLPKSSFPPGQVTANFVINFLVSCITAIFMISFLLRINAKSEEVLMNSERELRTSSEELAISKRRFELALQGSGAGIWDWDAINDKLYISSFLANLLGYPKDEVNDLTSEMFLDVVHPDDRTRFSEYMEGHLKKRLPFKIECRFKKGDGSYLWVLDTGQAQWTDQGRPVRMVGSIMDITERKQAEKKVYEQNLMLEKTNAELDRFVYSTSHDLRAPLSSVLGLINIAQLSDDPNEHHTFLEMMKERINTLNGFIGDIIDYSRNSRLSVVKEEVVLIDIVKEAVQNLQYFENSQLIDIAYEGVEDVSFQGDRSRLKIILNNIIANAIKYHNTDQPDPRVEITAKNLGCDLEIMVKDNGEGIEPELLDRIFEMFFRATVKSEGSGLGLYIAKEMADKLDGKIKVNSIKGKGTTFIVKLPIEQIADTIEKETVA